MAIITISRQNGSLGEDIAASLAARLGTGVISRGYALENFYGAIAPGTLDRLNESAKFFLSPLPGSQRTYADILVERVRTLASMNDNNDLVLLGLGGSVILSGHPSAIHVRITASEETRIKTIMRKYRITDAEARDVLTIGDRKHKRFVMTLFGKDVTSPELYDLILNTDRLTVDECVDAIIEGNVTMAISPDFYLPKFNLYLELTTMDQKYVTKKNKKMRLVRELYPGTNIRIVYKKDFQELVDRLKLFGGAENGEN